MYIFVHIIFACLFLQLWFYSGHVIYSCIVVYLDLHIYCQQFFVIRHIFGIHTVYKHKLHMCTLLLYILCHGFIVLICLKVPIYHTY